MRELKVKSPAKVNLFLDVLGKREDGYHEVEMVMQSIDLYDQLFLREVNKNRVELFCNREGVPKKDGLHRTWCPRQHGQED